MPPQLVDAHLSYVHGACDVPLLGVTIGDLLDRVAGRLPQQEALVSRHQALRYSYAALRDECNQFARGLLALGVQKGDRVGIWATNYAEWVIAQFATPKIGAILVNVNPAYRVHELEYALQQSGCSTLIIGPTFKTSDYTALLGQVCPELDSSSPGELHSARVPDLRTVVKFGDVRVPGTYHWDDVLVKGEMVSVDELSRIQREQQFDDPVNIQYTSGTTGFPKGATLSHHSIVNNAIFNGRCMRFSEQDRLCIPVPFYHCFGTVFSNLTCLAYAATMIIPAPVFDVRATLQAVEQERCTALHGVPTMFIAELNHPDFGQFDLSSLRTGAMAGAPCPIEVMKQVVQKMHMTDVSIAYGMTETSPASFQTMADAPLDKRVSTVGQIG
jgi:fatty-acyl-CoA synthase